MNFLSFVVFAIAILIVSAAPQRKGRGRGRAGNTRSMEKLEGESHGVGHYGTDLNKIMKDMQEIQRENGKRVFFKSVPTKTGSIETRVIIPDTQFNTPNGLTPVGNTQYIEGPEQMNQQALPQQASPPVEMNLPDKQFMG